MMRILSSLPKIYNPLIIAWNLLPKEQQIFELFKFKLLEEEEHINDQTSMEEETKAFATWSANRIQIPSGGSDTKYIPRHNNIIN